MRKMYSYRGENKNEEDNAIVMQSQTHETIGKKTTLLQKQFI